MVGEEAVLVVRTHGYHERLLPESWKGYHPLDTIGSSLVSLLGVFLPSCQQIPRAGNSLLQQQ